MTLYDYFYPFVFTLCVCICTYVHTCIAIAASYTCVTDIVISLHSTGHGV